MRTGALTTLAVMAFAANSILCRAALGADSIDAASFSSLRLLSGAVALSALDASRPDARFGRRANWTSAALLFLYAVPFSFAYIDLSTGTGALILFGSVQATMLISALASGEHPHPLQWVGLVVAVGGLVYLVLPGISAPSPLGSLLMAMAGVAWGLYSLVGRRAVDPLGETRDNFVRSLPMAAVVSLAAAGDLRITLSGAVLAVASGALASGVGYAVWYTALGGLTATLAATVQLSVPIIAAAGGIVFMGEAVTRRLLVSSVLVLGGVGLALGRSRTGRREG
jgi:drug/metabolite transporter (DMT)-like permease